jgi:hypothetical protein
MRVGMDVWRYGGSRRVWRRSKGLEAVEGCGGDRKLGGFEGSGGGQRHWRSQAPDAAQHEALETAGSSGSGRKLWRGVEKSGRGQRLWKRSKAQRQQARSFGGGKKL